MANINSKAAPAGSEVEHIIHEDNSPPLDFTDPHRAALEDNPEHAESLNFRTLAAVVSMALSIPGPAAVSYIVFASIVSQVAAKLGDTTHVTWVTGSFAVASAISFFIAGKLSDVFGRRWPMLLGNIISLAGAIVGATAQSTLQLVATITLVGFGVGLVWVSYAGIAEILPNRWRATGLAVTETLIVVPWALTGTLIGQNIYAHTALSWRWIFIISALIQVFALLGVFIFYHPPSRPAFDGEKSRWQELKEVDWLGCALFTGGLCVFLVGLTWGGKQHSWRSAAVIAPIVVGLCTLVATIIYDFTLAKNPFFPRKLLKQFRGYTCILVVISVGGMNYYSMASLLPQASLYMFAKGPNQIGIISLPNGFGQLTLGCVMSCLIGKVGHLKLQVIVWLSMMTIFLGLLAATVPNNKSAFMAFQFFGIGPFGTVTCLCYTIAGLNVPLKYLGAASGLIGTFRSVGGSLGNVIFNAILTSTVNDRLAPAIAKVLTANNIPEVDLGLMVGATVNNVLGIPHAFAELPEATPVVQAALAEALRQVYGQAFRYVFLTTIPFGVIAVICAFFIEDPSKYLTNHTAIFMEGQESRAQHGGRHAVGQTDETQVGEKSAVTLEPTTV